MFSFFQFYYNVIKRSPKRFDIAMGHPSGFAVMITPLFFFLIYAILATIFLPVKYLFFMYLFIPAMILNFVFVNKVSNKGYEIQRKEREKRWEAERMQREYEQRLRDEEIERMGEEMIRRHMEEARARAYRKQQYEQQRRQQYQQRQRASTQNNLRNAMKLLGLSEGFTEKDVKRAYRRLSKVHHPDVGGLEANFIKLNKAYEYIMDRI